MGSRRLQWLSLIVGGPNRCIQYDTLRFVSFITHIPSLASIGCILLSQEHLWRRLLQSLEDYSLQRVGLVQQLFAHKDV